jgi:hypothetical protein
VPAPAGKPVCGQCAPVIRVWAGCSSDGGSGFPNSEVVMKRSRKSIPAAPQRHATYIIAQNYAGYTMNSVLSGLVAPARPSLGRPNVSVNVWVGMPPNIVDRPMSSGWVLLKTIIQRTSSFPMFSM